MWEAVPSGKVPQSCDRIWFPMPKKMCVSVCLGTQKLSQPWECLALQACWRMKILFEKWQQVFVRGSEEKKLGGEGMKNYPVSNGDCKKPWSKDPVLKPSFFPTAQRSITLKLFQDLRFSTSCKITMKFTEMTWQKVWSSKAVKVEWSFGVFFTHFWGRRIGSSLRLYWPCFFKSSPDIPWPTWEYQKVFPPIFGRNNFWTEKKRAFTVNWQGSLGSSLSPKKTESPGCDEMVSDGMPLLQECCAKWPNMFFSNIWSNYSDLTRPHPKK